MREQTIHDVAYSMEVEGVRLEMLQGQQPDTLDGAGMFTDPLLAELSITGRLPLNSEVVEDNE